MRLYETTSTVTKNECNIPKRHAHYLQSMKMMRMMAVAFAVIGLVFGVASLQHSVAAAVGCVVMFGLVAGICILVGSWSSKRVAANFYADVDGMWTMTTWFDNDGIHRTDEDGDEFVYPLKRLACASRAGNVLILCTDMQAVLLVNLIQLNETDRKSVFERIKTECPKLKMVQVK